MSLFASITGKWKSQNDGRKVIELKGQKGMVVPVGKLDQVLRIRGGSSDEYDIFISFRFAEAGLEAIELQKALEARGLRVFRAALHAGENIEEAIVHALSGCKLAIILGSKTYGAGGTTHFSTKSELAFILDQKIPFFLVKMCEVYQENLTKFRLASVISYELWEPGSSLQPSLIEKILLRLGQINADPTRASHKPNSAEKTSSKDSTYKDFANGRYKGALRNGLPDGYGEMLFASGNKYVGEWKAGAKHGRGIYLCYADDEFFGNKYEGDFKADCYHGHGVYSYANGNKYIGYFKNGKKHGYGTDYYAGGERYEGEFKNDLKHGKGTYLWPDGSKYTGEWKNDVQHGEGILYDNYKRKQMKGTWNEGDFTS